MGIIIIDNNNNNSQRSKAFYAKNQQALANRCQNISNDSLHHNAQHVSLPTLR